jgi:hypothetical protein
VGEMAEKRGFKGIGQKDRTAWKGQRRKDPWREGKEERAYKEDGRE